MARRELHRLSARSVATLDKIGRHADGGNLYLAITPDGGRRWTFLYRERGTGRLREMGLGPAAAPKRAGVSLQDARRKAEAARRLLYDGKDPITEKRATAAANKTFGEFADELLETIGPGFKSAVHRAQWKSTLREYAAPLRPMLLKDITTADVLRVLQPIWESKHETAARLRGRIERVLDAAAAKKLRTGDNPARWRGHLKELLSKRRMLTRGHHSAIDYKDMPDFMRDLRAHGSVSALTLEFTILTAARTGEVIGARWSEIDFDERIWIVPASRMKAGREHRVPLTDRAVEVLRKLRPAGVDMDPDAFVFPGRKRGQPLSNMAMLELLRDLRGRGVTVHGFRSTFKDWASETTSHDNTVTEMALAHTVSEKVEAAYRRGTLFQKRQMLMDDWAQFLSGETATVVSIKRTPR